jgi:hypothetical protein
MKKKLVLAAIAIAFLAYLRLRSPSSDLTEFWRPGWTQRGRLFGSMHGGWFAQWNGEKGHGSSTEYQRAGFVYARVRYHIARRWNNEVPWHHDYPDGDTMFPFHLAKLTNTMTDEDAYQIVDIDSKELFRIHSFTCPNPAFWNCTGRREESSRVFRQGRFPING